MARLSADSEIATLGHPAAAGDGSARPAAAWRRWLPLAGGLAAVLALAWLAQRAAAPFSPAACKVVVGSLLAGGLGSWVVVSRRNQQRRDAAVAETTQALERRVAERTEQMARSEARLRRVQQIGGVGSFEIDLSTGASWHSAEYMQLHGLPPVAQIRDHDAWLARLHPDDRALAVSRFFAAIADGAPSAAYEQEYRIVTPEGVVRWISARAEVERDAAGRALRMRGVHVDISALKQAQAQAQEGEARLRAALRGARLGVWERHLPSGTGRWDARATEIYGGLSPDNKAPYLAEWRDRIHPEDRDARLAAIAATIPAGGADSYDVTFRFRKPDGSWNWVSVHGTVVERNPATGEAERLAGVVQDLTESNAAAAALRDSEERLRLAQEAGGVGSWDWNVATGEFFWSASCHRLHGTNPEAPITGAAWMAGVHPEDRGRIDAQQRAAISQGADGWEIEYRFRRPADGSTCWIVGRGRIFRDPATGRALRVRGVALDITERKQIEEQQRFLAREIDHRGKNTLSVVLAALRLTPKHDAASYASAIEGRVKALARAHTLLAEGRWAGADLRSLAEGELAPFLVAVPGAGPLATLDGPPVQLAPALAQGLSMALHELATNATKYGALSVPGGRLEVAWRLGPPEGLLRLRWRESGGPPVVAPTRRGFGSRVIEATVRDQLGGRVDRSWEPDGMLCRLDLPLHRPHGVAAEALPPA